jgi:sugar lactone lactonase YvrE
VRFYIAGVAANNNGQNTGDKTYLANYTLTHSLTTDAPRQITTFAGTGAPAYSGDTGPATAAALNMPQGVTVDGPNGVYIADAENHRVRLVAPDGTIRTVAGIGTPGATGDNGQATAAQLFSPASIAMDGSGGFYIADTGNHRIRRVFANGIIVTVAGTGTPGFSGDGGFATAAQLNFPSGLAADAAGNLYISEYGNHRIRKLDGAGLISTIAGTGVAGFNGDNQPATTAQLNSPRGLSLDTAGNLLVADFNNHRIRKLTPGANITTVAGTGAAGFSGDGGPATASQLQSPSGVAVDSQNSIYIADYGNHRIRKLSATGAITTYAGTGTASFSGDGGNATAAHLNGPWGVAVNSARDVLIADTLNHRIRRVIAPAIVPTTFDSLPSGLTLTIGGTAITAPATLQLEAGATISISAPATQPLTAGSRLGFASWSDAGAQSHSITVGPSASTFVANYAPQYLLTRSVTPATGGSITATPSSIDGFYPQNTAIQLTANPATGFAFTSFSGDATGATPAAVTMSAPRSVTAAFACSYQPSAPGSTVTAAPGAANFSVTTGVGCTVTPTSDAAWLTATATGNTVSYSYSANLTGLTRTANITTGNARFTVTQSPFLAPLLASATPPNTTTITQTFTLTARDANGVEDH